MPIKWTRHTTGVNVRVPQEYQVIHQCAAATAVDGFVYVATHPVQVIGVKAVWNTASGSGTAVLKKCSSTTVAGGVAMHATGIDTATTAATVNTVTLTSNQTALTLNAGDAIGIDWTGTVTGLVACAIAISLKKLDT